jgi:hypothetical protein
MRSAFARMAEGMLVAGTLSVSACGVKENVSLFVYARAPSLVKGSNEFGPKLDGSVDVVFDLGSYAGDPVTVEAIQLGVYRDDVQLVPRARLEPAAGTSFPFDLAPGKSTTIRYTVRPYQLDPGEPAALCAGPVVISGAVKQAGKAEIRISSDLVNVAGCP